MSSIAGSSVKQTRVRNGCCQTVLSFPPILPKEIEDLLAPFCTFTQVSNASKCFSRDFNKKYLIFQDQQQSLTQQDCDTTVDYEARDASLRRKLFEVPFEACSTTTHNVSHDSLHGIDLQALSPPPKTPEIVSEPIVDFLNNIQKNF